MDDIEEICENVLYIEPAAGKVMFLESAKSSFQVPLHVLLGPSHLHLQHPLALEGHRYIYFKFRISPTVKKPVFPHKRTRAGKVLFFFFSPSTFIFHLSEQPPLPSPGPYYFRLSLATQTDLDIVSTIPYQYENWPQSKFKA